jgi:uncharacterized protein
MNELVFLDASFWIAYRDEKQEKHPEAKRILPEIFRRKVRFVITLPVLCEAQAHFCRSMVKKRTVLNDFWNNPLVRIEEVTNHDQEKAIEILRTHWDKTYSFCDSTSFVVMQRLGLKQVLAFDNHFRQFGEFDVLS